MGESPSVQIGFVIAHEGKAVNCRGSQNFGALTIKGLKSMLNEKTEARTGNKRSKRRRRREKDEENRKLLRTVTGQWNEWVISHRLELLSNYSKPSWAKGSWTLSPSTIPKTLVNFPMTIRNKILQFIQSCKWERTLCNYPHPTSPKTSIHYSTTKRAGSIIKQFDFKLTENGV